MDAMTKQEIIELIKEKQGRELRKWQECNKLYPSLYGTGVAWGGLEMCNEILNDIFEI